MPDDWAPDEILRRYLVAFWPATIADIQAWSGLRGVRTPVHGMREYLWIFRNERGQELFDVPGFDNVLLSH